METLVLFREASDGKKLEIKVTSYTSTTWTVILGAIFSRTGSDLEILCDQAEQAYERYVEKRARASGPAGSTDMIEAK